VVIGGDVECISVYICCLFNKVPVSSRHWQVVSASLVTHLTSLLDEPLFATVQYHSPVLIDAFPS
jgi:hypothetical protein